MPLPITMACTNPPAAADDSPRSNCGDTRAAMPRADVRRAGRVVDELNNEQTMRLSKTEWMGVAVMAGSIACFGGWLQGEMNRATLARIQRDTLDSPGACGDMSARDAEMLGKGELWCGAIGAGRADAPGKA
jgi:hypothetical protein